MISQSLYVLQVRLCLSQQTTDVTGTPQYQAFYPTMEFALHTKWDVRHMFLSPLFVALRVGSHLQVAKCSPQQLAAVRTE